MLLQDQVAGLAAAYVALVNALDKGGCLSMKELRTQLCKEANKLGETSDDAAEFVVQLSKRLPEMPDDQL